MKPRLPARTALLLAVAVTLCPGALIAQAQQDVQSLTTDAGTIRADQVKRLFKKSGYSPYAGRNFPTRVFWGDQYLHTSWSGDAGAAGTRLGPEEAVRFARGEEVVSTTGQAVKLSRPLDWIAVTDHSDGLGVVTEVIAGNPKMMTDPIARRWNQQMKAGPEESAKVVMEIITLQGQGKLAARSLGPEDRPRHVEEEHGDHGEIQRAWALHRLHRLRVDVELRRRQQPAPQRHLPRRQGQG